MKRGFTLVELMVALFLTSILGVLAYALFATTSDNLQEVDNLEATASKTRFAVEQLRRMFQAAGSGSTPDSTLDTRVLPRAADGLGYHVAGFLTYNDWQGELETGANPWVSTDGVILVGAFDFPSSFEAGGFERGSATSMTIPGHYRGMERLAVPDPFSDVVVGTVASPNLELTRDWSDFNSYAFMQRNFDARLIRISDAQGYTQFLAPKDPLSPGDVSGPSLSPFSSLSIEMDLSTPFRPYFKDVNRANISTPPFQNVNMSEIGLDLASENEGDRGYDAVFVDAYWIHVVDSESDPGNDKLLVMDRLCAKKLFAATTDISSLNPQTMLAGGPCGETERYVITDKVVDFQVWFDCATLAIPDPDDSTAPPIGYTMQNNTNWDRDWLAPDNTGTCADPVAGTFTPGRARVAHFRLSLRTSTERKSLSHYQFETGDDVCSDPASCPGATLKTYDIADKVEGAAAVVTVQSDVQMYNFAIRDL